MLTSDGNNLRSLRTRLGIGQLDLARASGLTRQAIYLIERGLRRPTQATLLALGSAMERLRLDQVRPMARKGLSGHDDPESRKAGRRLEMMGIEELLAVKVRLMPYFVERGGPSMARWRPDGSRSQIVDGLQARAILRLFNDLLARRIDEVYNRVEHALRSSRAAQLVLQQPDALLREWVKAYLVGTPEEIAERLRPALQHEAISDVVVSPRLSTGRLSVESIMETFAKQVRPLLSGG